MEGSHQSEMNIKAKLLSYREQLSSTFDSGSSTSDSDSTTSYSGSTYEDRWSTNRLMSSLSSLPLSISSSISNASGNNIENMTTVTVAFQAILLAPLKRVVSERIEDYLSKYDWSLMKVDPTIKTTRLNHPKSKATNVLSRHDLAFLFLESLDQNFIKTLNLDDCGDVRVFLKIMNKAGCFTKEENDLALNLKKFRNQMAHENTFEREFIKNVLNDINRLLQIFESNHRHDTSKYQRELKQLKKFGAKHFLQKNQKHSQLSTLRQSLLSTASSELENTIVGSIIDSTITSVNNEVIETNRIASETLKNWQNIEVQNCKLVCDFYTPRSNKGKEANLESLLMRKHQKSTKETIIGNNFKVASTKFAEGSSRIAYRGHFEGQQQFQRFVDNPEVVLKKTKDNKKHNTIETLVKIQYYVSVLIAGYNEKILLVPFSLDNLEEESIQLLSLFVCRKEDMTMEPYIDHTSYTKWSNNYGYVNTASYEPYIDAFSHWTYQVSRGQLIVVDLQGLKKENVFFITDPAIHSSSGDFGSTDKKALGIAKFFKTHVCNDKCKALNLTDQTI